MNTATLIDFDEQEELDQEPEPEPPLRTKEERRAWYQEALDSLEHFERTGLHITFEEYSAWVDRLDTDPDAPFPKCHV